MPSSILRTFKLVILIAAATAVLGRALPCLGVEQGPGPPPDAEPRESRVNEDAQEKGFSLPGLRERGITFGLSYLWDVFHNSRLQPRDNTRYEGVFEISVRADTKKAGLWDNGEFFIKAQNSHGNGTYIDPGGNRPADQFYYRRALYPGKRIRDQAEALGKIHIPFGKA